MGVKSEFPYFHLCEGQLSFLDEISIVAGGGRYKKGYVYAKKFINSHDWFFPCHFYQDPVMPGSLGVEAIIQALQAFAIQNRLGDIFRNPRFFNVPSKTKWKYRGQIIPENSFMQLEVHVKKLEKTDKNVILYADANLWREELRIYEIFDIVLGIKESG